jgi:CubicO group peptidase (beta-lactamase class C family)
MMVYCRGKVVRSALQGLADAERNILVRDDTSFPICSMTKPITWVAFMMLVEEGRVALEDPVAKHIPECRELAVYVGGSRCWAGRSRTARRNSSPRRARG